MNPVSRKNPLDSAKYREQYLSNLRLQASNDQRNQNANSIFKQTGQTPSRPPDTRTTTERASDIEALKVDLRSKLGQITDGIIASQIIGELEPTQIRFAIDNWGTIEPDMKRQFGSGVPTSAFIAYLNRLISKFQLTDGVETGLQQSSGNAILMSNTQILYGLPRLQIWNTLKGVADKAQRLLGINVSPLFKEIEENINILPSLQEQQILSQIPPELKAEVIILANRMYNNVASNGEIADLIQDISLGLANRDKRYTQKAINDGIELLALDDSVIEDKNEIAFLFKTFFKQGAQDDSVAIESGDNEVPILGLEQEPYLEEIFPNPKTAVEPEIGSKQIEEANPSTLDELYRSVPRMYSELEWVNLGTKNKKAKNLFLSARLYNNPDLILYNSNKRGRTPYQNGKRMPNVDRLTNEDLDSLFLSYLSQTQNGTIGEGLNGKMCGKGLTKTKIEKPYRQSISHLMDKPMEKPKPYTQFGRYYINKHRLEGEGIVAFRQPSGNTIPNLPTEKISKPLSKVVRTLVGKGLPSYEDINDLSREDKIKLNQICKTCKVDSPAIPKIKGEGEQEEDRFNILRGEIIAGNDNAKIAKAFKVMLMKFMNEGRIPRRQANEILQELLALGH